MKIEKEDQKKRFTSVYQLYVDEVYQYIYLRTGLNRSVAEDITQSIFLDVFKGLTSFRGLCSERTWIYKIARNKLNDYYRMQYRTPFHILSMDDAFTQEQEDPDCDVQKIMTRTLEQERVRDCLNHIPKQYKIVLILKYIDERSVREIAEIVEKSPKAVESVLQRAKKSFIHTYIAADEEEM